MNSGKRVALIDMNSFFASCECVFQPELRRKPLVVLSSNDGCVIARSAEAKALKIPMGEPAFRLKELLRSGKLLARSSNFCLYADLSSRVMATLAEEGFPLDVYSIDEAFIDLTGHAGLHDWAMAIRAKVLRHVGIPSSIGIAPTKTLAKLANEHAKGTGSGVFLLPDDAAERDRFLAARSAADVWGIGGQTAPGLASHGINTALDLARADMQRLRQRFGVTVARTSLELSGQPCLAVGEEPQPPQSITVSRTFGEPTDQTDDVRAAVAVFLENACAKARLQGVVASHLAIWLVPRELGTGDQSCTIPLRTPTANTCELQEIAGAALVRLCKPGIWYRKAGVGLLGLQADGPIQQDFLDPRDRSRDSRRQAAVDAINALAGKRTVRSATTLLSQEWQPASRLMSRHYTSRWDELMEAR